MTKPVKTEQLIQSEILKYLLSNGFFAWKNASGSISRSYFCQRDGRMKHTFFRAGIKGMPDILAVKSGNFYAIEVKTMTGKTSPEQKATIEMLKKYGTIAFVARSLDEVKMVLEMN